MTEERPTKCEICGKQLYYTSDIRHEPEVSIWFTDTNMGEKVMYDLPYVCGDCADEVKIFIDRLQREHKVIESSTS